MLPKLFFKIYLIAIEAPFRLLAGKLKTHLNILPFLKKAFPSPVVIIEIWSLIEFKIILLERFVELELNATALDLCV